MVEYIPKVLSQKTPQNSLRGEDIDINIERMDKWLIHCNTEEW
jgi:hypothetical protein